MKTLREIADSEGISPQRLQYWLNKAAPIECEHVKLNGNLVRLYDEQQVLALWRKR